MMESKAVCFPRTARQTGRGFTLVELLVATAVLVLILVLFLKIISGATSVTRRAGETISSFQEARAAFDILTANLSQATVTASWNYDNPNNPVKYRRDSALQFLVVPAGGNFPGTAGTGQGIFFQAPLGVTANRATYGELGNLMNACGYFIVYGNDAGPFLRETNYGYRLMQAVEPAENLKTYLSSQEAGLDWTANLNSYAVPIAKNIIYMVAWPRKSAGDDATGNALSTDYSYNSRLQNTADPQPVTANQQPPTVQIMMVALDESSARRIDTGSTPPSDITAIFSGNHLFETSSETQFQADLSTMQKALADKHLSARIFTAVVPIRESKMQ